MNKYTKSLKKTARGLKNILPMIIGVILLTGLIKQFITERFIQSFFTQITVLDSVIGSFSGSILAGNPVTSYILAGEMVKNGTGIIPATAFITAWVTVGIVQLPAEMEALGTRFAITRNILSFVSSIIIAIITGIILGGV